MKAADTASNKSTPLETVLLVENEVLVRFAISEYLRECGFRVIEAANAGEAITLLEEPGLAVDVVLCDIEISGSMDGFGLAQWVRSNKHGLPIILAGTPARIASEAGELCNDGPQLAKPYAPATLLDQIKRLLAERKPISFPE